MKHEQELTQSPLIKTYLMDVEAKNQFWDIGSIYSHYGIEFQHFHQKEMYSILDLESEPESESLTRYQSKKNNVSMEALIHQFMKENPSISFQSFIGKHYLKQFSSEELDNALSYKAKPIFIPKSLLPNPDDGNNYFLNDIYVLNHENQIQFFINLFTLNSSNEAFSESIGKRLIEKFLENCTESVIDSLVVECFKIKNLNLLTTLLLSPKADTYLLIDTYHSISVRSAIIKTSYLKSVNEQEKLRNLFAPVGLLSYAILKWKEAFPTLLGMINPPLEEALYNAEIGKSQRYKSKPTLHYAVMEENLKAIEELLKAGVDINTPDTEGRTALHWAVIQNNPIITELLLNRGADVNKGDFSKRTPLHFAAIKNNEKVTKALLNSKPELNAQDIYKCTPLHIAALYNSDVVINLLIEERANYPGQDHECLAINPIM